MSVSSVSPNPWATQAVEGAVDSSQEAVATWINENQISNLMELSRPQINSLVQRLSELNASNNVPGLDQLVTDLKNNLNTQPLGNGGTDMMDLRLAVFNTLAQTTGDSSNPLSIAANQAQKHIDTIINEIVLDFFAGADAETILEDD